MIARIWHSTVTLANAEKYQEYLYRTIIPSYQTAEGNQGVHVMKDRQGELVHFLLLTFWTSDAALAKYIGISGDVINPSPEEKSLLIAFESTAKRYKVVGSLAKIRESYDKPERHDQTFRQ